MWRHPNEFHDSMRRDDVHLAVLRSNGIEVVHVSVVPRHDAGHCESPSWWWANLRDLGIERVSATHLAPSRVSPTAIRFMVVKCPECDAFVERFRAECDIESVTHPKLVVCEDCVGYAASI